MLKSPVGLEERVGRDRSLLEGSVLSSRLSFGHSTLFCEIRKICDTTIRTRPIHDGAGHIQESSAYRGANFELNFNTMGATGTDAESKHFSQ